MANVVKPNYVMKKKRLECYSPLAYFTFLPHRSAHYYDLENH